jgi:hypothetical protein
MTEETENSALQILEKLQADNQHFRQEFDYIKARLASVENHLDFAQLSARINTLSRRLERMEVRLGLLET